MPFSPLTHQADVPSSRSTQIFLTVLFSAQLYIFCYVRKAKLGFLSVVMNIKLEVDVLLMPCWRSIY